MKTGAPDGEPPHDDEDPNYKGEEYKIGGWQLKKLVSRGTHEQLPGQNTRRQQDRTGC